MVKAKNIPAIAGGKPVRDSYLHFGVPDVREEDIKRVVGVLKSKWITTGPETFEFEKKLKKLCGAKYVHAVNSCTAALHLALVVSKIGPGDEVITSPMTFASAVNVIVQVRAIPVFVDVDAETGNIDVSQIEKKITRRTRAIIITHLYGRPCEMGEILKIAKKHKLVVISDAAHALGAKYHGKSVGSIGDFTAFSFYVTKNITTGEGGALTTNRQEWSDLIEIYKLHGLSRDAWKRYHEKSIKYYTLTVPGYKYNLADMNAALGNSQLERFGKMQERREAIWDIYDRSLSDLALAIPQKVDKNIVHAKHIYSILLNLDKLKVSRDKIREALALENIGTSVHFISLHLQPFYKKLLGCKPSDFPNALYLSERLISLPLSQNFSDNDVADVIAAVKKVVKYFSK